MKSRKPQWIGGWNVLLGGGLATVLGTGCTAKAATPLAGPSQPAKIEQAKQGKAAEKPKPEDKTAQDLPKQVEETAKKARLARMELEVQLREWKVFKSEEPKKVEETQRVYDEAKEALSYYDEVSKDHGLKKKELVLQKEEDEFEAYGERLKQLEKMYKEDELVDETEELVLKQARRGFERAKVDIEIQRRAHQRYVEYELPKEREKLETASHQRQLALEKTHIALDKVLLGKENVSTQENAKLDKLVEELDKLPPLLEKLGEDQAKQKEELAAKIEQARKDIEGARSTVKTLEEELGAFRKEVQRG
jgi:hypothetical protein